MAERQGVEPFGTGLSPYNGLANGSFLAALTRFKGLQSDSTPLSRTQGLSFGRYCAPLCAPDLSRELKRPNRSSSLFIGDPFLFGYALGKKRLISWLDEGTEAAVQEDQRRSRQCRFGGDSSECLLRPGYAPGTLALLSRHIPYRTRRQIIAGTSCRRLTRLPRSVHSPAKK